MSKPDSPFASSRRPSHLRVIATFAAIGSVACSSDDSASIQPPSGPARENVTTYYSAEEFAGTNSVFRSDDRFGDPVALQIGQNRAMALDYDGTLYQVGAGANGAGVRAMSRARNREADAAFTPGQDREIGGIQAGLQDPVNMTLARREGLLFISDRGTSSISVHGADSNGDAPPIGRTQLASPPSATAYDEENDRLFVAREGGHVDRFDGYLNETLYEDSGLATPSGSFTLRRRAGSVEPSVPMSLSYDASRDCLYVADCGEVGAAMDGAVHRVDGASQLSGDVDPSFTLAGPNSGLMDPTGIEVFAGRARVADRGAGEMRQYELGDADLGEMDRFPFASANAPGAASVVTEPSSVEYGTMPSDIDDPTTPLTGFTVASLPRDGAFTNNQVSRFDTDDDATYGFDARFDSNNQMCSLSYDAVGNGFLGYEDPVAGTGGVSVISRLGTGRRRAGFDDSFTTARDRRLEGPQTGLTSPRDIDLDDASGSMFVTDHGSRTVRVFDKGAVGDVPPRFVTNTTGAPYGIDYDFSNDRLYVSGDDGCVCVYDRFLETRPSQPDRRFSFNNGVAGTAQESQNLRGLSYDETNDRLLVTDIGADASLNDGRVYGFEGASLANSVMTPNVRLMSSAMVPWMEPTGVAFNGSNAYVSDSTAGAVRKYDDIFNAQEPQLSSSFAATNAGTISLSARSMAPTTGGSYR